MSVLCVSTILVDVVVVAVQLVDAGGVTVEIDVFLAETMYSVVVGLCVTTVGTLALDVVPYLVVHTETYVSMEVRDAW